MLLENASIAVRGARMNTTRTLTAACTVPGAGWMMRSRRADARLAPGARDRPWQRGSQAAPGPPAGEAARGQRILDLLDPDKRCGAWSSATVEGRPAVCTRAPHDAREEHANAETGWRWDGEDSRRHPLPAITAPGRRSPVTPDRLPRPPEVPGPASRATLAHPRRKDPSHVTTISPRQRMAVGRHRRELELILASAPAGAAVVVACSVPPATCGPPPHTHATSDEALYVLSGVLLVRDDGQVAVIPEGGLVHLGRGTPHTFATPPGAAARFLILHTRFDHGDVLAQWPASAGRTDARRD